MVNAAPVYAVFEAGLRLLGKAISDCTGDPGELRAKADECVRCASEVGSAARDTGDVVTNLGQTWRGQSYDSCSAATAKLVGELTDVLKRSLEQEGQRLNGAAQALTRARSEVEQQKQQFNQKLNSIIGQMWSEISRALSRTPPDIGAALAAVAKALGQASAAKSQAEADSERTKNELGDTLMSLFVGGVRAGNLLAPVA